MSSMTIDQLKKSLMEQGITLPPSRSKKADYLKLYKQYSSINDSLGDIYSSDDENPPKSSSQSVSSSTSPGKSENIIKEVEQLTDEELYHQLKEFDPKIGPVLKNTRRVYEKKLIKLLSGNEDIGPSTNKELRNFGKKATVEQAVPSVEEFSDSDIEVTSKSFTKTEAKPRKSSVLRDSPKHGVPESTKPDAEKLYSSNYEYSNRKLTQTYGNEPKTSRYSYIETIPKGSTHGYIEPGLDTGFNNDLTLRFAERYNSDKYSGKHSSNKSASDDHFKQSFDIGDQYKPVLSTQYKYGLSGDDDQFNSGVKGGMYKTLSSSNKSKSGGSIGDRYIGTWEPNISSYLTSSQKKIPSKQYNYSGWLKNIFAALLILGILLIVVYLFQQPPVIDQYKKIEDDAKRTIEESPKSDF